MTDQGTVGGGAGTETGTGAGTGTGTETGTGGERSTAGTADRRGGRYWLVYPAYGPVESVVGYLLFYLVVDAVTPVLAAAVVERVPSWDPGTVTTAAAIALWLLLVLTVLTVVTTQLDDNPRRFDTAAARRAYLDRVRPSILGVGLDVGLLVVGAAVAALAWGPFFDALRELLPALVLIDGGVPPGLNAGNVATVVLFSLAFAAFSHGVDRILVGALREGVYRAYSD